MTRRSPVRSTWPAKPAIVRATDPDGWGRCVLAVFAPFIVGLPAWLYALALQS